MKFRAPFAILVLLVHASKPKVTTKEKDKCTLPEDQGNCRGLMKRWFFDSKSKKCEPFVYGGCDGNANNFQNIVKCMKACTNIDPCTLSKEEGSCKSYIHRWFYNHTSERCQIFAYGGCEGNENNFSTKDECLWNCNSNGTDIEVGEY